MPRLVLPAPVGRSPTAVQNQSDVRDDNLYSAGVVQHGATGTLSLFTVPKGQTIPVIKGSSITATTQAHQTTYTSLTTNLNKAGEFGSGIGDASVRAVAINVEQTQWGYSSGTVGSYGAGPLELADIQSKMYFEFKIGQKKYTEGPVAFYGASGGMAGSVVAATTANNVTLNQAAVLNGANGPRRLKLPILIHRSDTVEGVLGVAGAASLVFGVQSSQGQPTLIWVHLFATIRGDAR